MFVIKNWGGGKIWQIVAKRRKMKNESARGRQGESI